MRVAVLGASGLIGSAMAEQLRTRGHEVVSVGRGGQGVQGVQWDLCSGRPLPGQALEGCGALIHAAGVTDEDFADRSMAFTKATQGTRALMAAATAANVKKLVYVSSAHVYGPLEGRIDEGSPANPVSDYARAHFEAEQIVRAWGAAGGAALILRPCAVFGMPPSLERFARWSLIPFAFPRSALAGEIGLRTRGDQVRNFVAADALAAAACDWLEAGNAGIHVDNAPGETEMAVYDFAVLCAQQMRRETGRACRVNRPDSAAGPARAPFRYESRGGRKLRGLPLEEHVRRLLRRLIEAAEERR